MTADRYSVAAVARFAGTARSLTDRQTWATNLCTAIRTVLRHTNLAAEQDVRALDLDQVLDSFARDARGDLSAAEARRLTRFIEALVDGAAPADLP